MSAKKRKADEDLEGGFGVTVPETGKCVICHGRYELYGCDCDPVSCVGRCCHECEKEVVIPARKFIYGLVEHRIVKGRKAVTA